MEGDGFQIIAGLESIIKDRRDGRWDVHRIQRCPPESIVANLSDGIAIDGFRNVYPVQPALEFCDPGGAVVQNGVTEILCAGGAQRGQRIQAQKRRKQHDGEEAERETGFHHRSLLKGKYRLSYKHNIT